MRKNLCRIITIVSLLLLVTSTAVFAADEGVPGTCNYAAADQSKDVVSAIRQRLYALGYSEEAIKEYLAAKEAERTQVYQPDRLRGFF